MGNPAPTIGGPLCCDAHHLVYCKMARYSIFGIGVDRRRIAKWLFPQEKATFHDP
jgi:hypothetical protein